MSKRAKHRKITVDGDTYTWVVASLETTIDGRPTKKQVFIRPLSYRGHKLEAYLGDETVAGDWESEVVTVQPHHVADFIKANKDKF